MRQNLFAAAFAVAAMTAHADDVTLRWLLPTVDAEGAVIDPALYRGANIYCGREPGRFDTRQTYLGAGLRSARVRLAVSPQYCTVAVLIAVQGNIIEPERLVETGHSAPVRMMASPSLPPTQTTVEYDAQGQMCTTTTECVLTRESDGSTP